MKILKYITVLIVVSMSFAPAFSASEIGIIYDNFDDKPQLKESCPLGPGYDYSSWSGPKVDNIGYHPETKNWAKVSGYHYTEGNGPKVKADIGYGPFTYVAGNVGNAGKLVKADASKQTRLYMRVYFNTRTYKRESAYPCNTISTNRQYRVDHEAYYAKVRS